MSHIPAIFLALLSGFIVGMFFVMAGDETKCFADPTFITHCVMDRDVKIYLSGQKVDSAPRGYVFLLGGVTK